MLSQSTFLGCLKELYEQWQRMLSSIGFPQYNFVWYIYIEITGDYSAPDTKQQTQFDLKMQTVMGNLDLSLCRDLWIYNACKSKYIKVWEIAAEKVEEMAVADDQTCNSISGNRRCSGEHGFGYICPWSW